MKPHNTRSTSIVINPLAYFTESIMDLSALLACADYTFCSPIHGVSDYYNPSASTATTKNNKNDDDDDDDSFTKTSEEEERQQQQKAGPTTFGFSRKQLGRRKESYRRSKQRLPIPKDVTCKDIHVRVIDPKYTICEDDYLWDLALDITDDIQNTLKQTFTAEESNARMILEVQIEYIRDGTEIQKFVTGDYTATGWGNACICLSWVLLSDETFLRKCINNQKNQTTEATKTSTITITTKQEEAPSDLKPYDGGYEVVKQSLFYHQMLSNDYGGRLLQTSLAPECCHGIIEKIDTKSICLPFQTSNE